MITMILTAIRSASLARADDISPELRKKIDDMDRRIEFMRTNECPIYIQLSSGWNDTSRNVCFRGHTNVVVYEPVPEQLFDVHLFSENGKEIARTSSCKFGQTLKPDKALLAGNFYIQDDALRGHERRMDFKDGNYSHFWNLDIMKLFRIKKPGNYRLQVQGRLFTKDANGVFHPFILPQVETEIGIGISDSRIKDAKSEL